MYHAKWDGTRGPDGCPALSTPGSCLMPFQGSKRQGALGEYALHKWTSLGAEEDKICDQVAQQLQ